MSNHVFFIDPLLKLNLQKDSSLYLAHAVQKRGDQAFALFEEDFFYSNTGEIALKVRPIQLDDEDDFVKSVTLLHPETLKLEEINWFHMRLDPPFDGRYLRYLWILQALKERGLRIINDPDGILLFNEKLTAYSMARAHPTFVGASFEAFERSLDGDIIVKPLDLYQGKGVEKFSLTGLKREEKRQFFERKKVEMGGVVVAQPFIKEVASGEIRALFFDGLHLGSILKTPKQGDFLANIAQGASYKSTTLTPELHGECQKLCQRMGKHGIRFVAFDLLAGKISEANVTCPGLLVEVSKANHKNLAEEILTKL
ncbi:MAG: hypothetical protein A2X86_16580 [Bdellovibrionales bacterium GWA2_49_15]|nr:MAG: hypothetical protein A2X86_16580 [Bdellovibrionales bacterium GWA2_49_15]HAZ13722.1 hypothetical protein [Bdellovibrionales bacterium]